MGTNTAYGKLAVIPLIAFWLFVVWMVVILGAEVSFLVQNETDILAEAVYSPTFMQARGLVTVLVRVHSNFLDGKGPVSWESLLGETGMGAHSLRVVLAFLTSGKWIVETLPEGDTEDDAHCYLPARDLSQVNVGEVLKAFLAEDDSERDSSGKWNKQWKQSVDGWLESLENVRLSKLAAPVNQSK